VCNQQRRNGATDPLWFRSSRRVRSKRRVAARGVSDYVAASYLSHSKCSVLNTPLASKQYLVAWATGVAFFRRRWLRDRLRSPPVAEFVVVPGYDKEPTMPAYRIYSEGDDGNFSSAPEFVECADDKEIVDKAMPGDERSRFRNLGTRPFGREASTKPSMGSFHLSWRPHGPPVLSENPCR
jgi:hypothetical protein